MSRGHLTVAYVSQTEPGTSASAQVGYAVSRRCGTAVQRNRLRRRLRAAVRTAAAEGDLAAGSYLLRPDPELAALDHQDLTRVVHRALRDAPRRASRRAPR